MTLRGWRGSQFPPTEEEVITNVAIPELKKENAAVLEAKYPTATLKNKPIKGIQVSQLGTSLVCDPDELVGRTGLGSHTCPSFFSGSHTSQAFF